MSEKIVPAHLHLLRILDLTSCETLSKEFPNLSITEIQPIHERIKIKIADKILELSSISELGIANNNFSISEPGTTNTNFFQNLKAYFDFGCLQNSIIDPYSDDGYLNDYIDSKILDFADLTFFHKYFYELCQKFLKKQGNGKNMNNSIFHLFHRHIFNKLRIMSFTDINALHSNFNKYQYHTLQISEFSEVVPNYFINWLIDIIKENIVNKRVNFDVFRQIAALQLRNDLTIGLLYALLKPENIFLEAMFSSQIELLTTKTIIHKAYEKCQKEKTTYISYEDFISHLNDFSDESQDLLKIAGIEFDTKQKMNPRKFLNLDSILEKIENKATFESNLISDALVHKYVDVNSRIFEFSSGKSNESTTKIQKAFLLKSWLKLLNNMDNEAISLFSDAIRVGQVSQDDHTVDAALLFLSTIYSLNRNYLKQSEIFYSFFSSEFHEKDSAQQFYFCISNETFNRNGILLNNSKSTDSKVESLNFFSIISNCLKRIAIESEENFFLRNAKIEARKNNFMAFLNRKNDCTIQNCEQYFNNYRDKVQAVFNLKKKPVMETDFLLFYKILDLFIQQDFREALIFTKKIDEGFTNCDCSSSLENNFEKSRKDQNGVFFHIFEKNKKDIIGVFFDVFDKLEKKNRGNLGHVFIYTSMCDIFLKIEEIKFAETCYQQIKRLSSKKERVFLQYFEHKKTVLKLGILLKKNSGEKLMENVQKIVEKFNSQSYMGFGYFEIIKFKVKHLIKIESFVLAHIEIVENIAKLESLDLPQFYIQFKVLEMEVLVRMFKLESAEIVADRITSLIFRSDSSTKAEFYFQSAMIYFLKITTRRDICCSKVCEMYLKMGVLEAVKVLDLEIIKKCVNLLIWTRKLNNGEGEMDEFYWKVIKVFDFVKVWQESLVNGENCVRNFVVLNSSCVEMLYQISIEQFSRF